MTSKYVPGGIYWSHLELGHGPKATEGRSGRPRTEHFFTSNMARGKVIDLTVSDDEETIVVASKPKKSTKRKSQLI